MLCNNVFSTCSSIFIEDFKDMLGDFSSCTIMSPSSSTGMKLLPKSLNNTRLTINTLKDASTKVVGFFVVLVNVIK